MTGGQGDRQGAARLQTIAQVNAFPDVITDGAFRVPKTERDQFIERMRTGFGYAEHEKLKSTPDAQQ
jgi:hypothetical protein